MEQMKTKLVLDKTSFAGVTGVTDKTHMFSMLIPCWSIVIIRMNAKLQRHKQWHG